VSHPDAGSAPDPLRERLEASLSGAFRIERELGGGGMARVFLAEERALGRRVVVKVLSPELVHDFSAERFAREVRLSARLQHPNIVPVLTAGAAGDVPYYTMPFIEGESLRARLDRLGPGERLPPAEALAVLRDVARALAYAHEFGVVHRDIKPENVLLAYDAAVVADFGVAKALAVARTEAGAGAAGTLTQAGVLVGTPAYMSPEQAAGDPNVDHRADVYAWGILAYELLAGSHPFADRRTVQSLITANLVEPPRALSDRAAEVGPAIAGLVMRCLAKDPRDRPPTAREIVDLLPAKGDSAARRPGDCCAGPSWRDWRSPPRSGGVQACSGSSGARPPAPRHRRSLPWPRGGPPPPRLRPTPTCGAKCGSATRTGRMSRQASRHSGRRSRRTPRSHPRTPSCRAPTPSRASTLRPTPRRSSSARTPR
jgi:serine/threonine-protein kinase